METSKQEAQDRIRQMAERLSAIDGARTALNYIEQQGARIAELEQRPAVPEGFRIFRSPHEGDADIHLAMKLGDEGYLMSSWLSEGGRDADDTVGRLAYRLADALLSAQPTKQRPAPAVPQGWQPMETAPKDGSTILLGNEHGCWAARYQPVYQSGYRPDDPWFSMMLSHEYRRKNNVLQFAPPTHWMPLPALPEVKK